MRSRHRRRRRLAILQKWSRDGGVNPCGSGDGSHREKTTRHRLPCRVDDGCARHRGLLRGGAEDARRLPRPARWAGNQVQGEGATASRDLLYADSRGCMNGVCDETIKDIHIGTYINTCGALGCRNWRSLSIPRAPKAKRPCGSCAGRSGLSRSPMLRDVWIKSLASRGQAACQLQAGSAG